MGILINTQIILQWSLVNIRCTCVNDVLNNTIDMNMRRILFWKKTFSKISLFCTPLQRKICI